MFGHLCIRLEIKNTGIPPKPSFLSAWMAWEWVNKWVACFSWGSHKVLPDSHSQHSVLPSDNHKSQKAGKAEIPHLSQCCTRVYSCQTLPSAPSRLRRACWSSALWNAASWASALRTQRKQENASLRKTIYLLGCKAALSMNKLNLITASICRANAPLLQISVEQRPFVRQIAVN